VSPTEPGIEDETAAFFAGDRATGMPFRAEDGRFELHGLDTGEWLVEPRARGYTAEQVRITLPYSGDLRLVLEPEATDE